MQFYLVLAQLSNLSVLPDAVHFMMEVVYVRQNLNRFSSGRPWGGSACFLLCYGCHKILVFVNRRFRAKDQPGEGEIIAVDEAF